MVELLQDMKESVEHILMDYAEHKKNHYYGVPLACVGMFSITWEQERIPQPKRKENYEMHYILSVCDNT